jgi:hypothetical protein
MRDWRTELFYGLPTDFERRTDAAIDEAVAKRILAVEGMAISKEEAAHFLQVVHPRDPRARGLFAITWKGIPIVDIVRKGKWPNVKIMVLERNVETGERGGPAVEKGGNQEG